MRNVHNENEGQQLDADSDIKNASDLTIWQVTGSTLASFFGVQSSKNRKRDFNRGKAKHFIIVGMILTITFCLILLGVVSTVIQFAK
tara:strand:+ start:13886 stop:14146 length:261 start_codon:yes stop_codon:yes gene_type:complete